MTTLEALKIISRLSNKKHLVKGHFLELQRALTALGVSEQDKDKFSQYIGFSKSLVESFGPASIVIYYSYDNKGYKIRVFNQDTETLIQELRFRITSLVRLSDIKSAAFIEAKSQMHKYGAFRISQE